VSTLNTLFYAVSITPFIALPFLIVNWVRYLKIRAENKSRRVALPAKMPLKSVLFFAVPIVIAISIAEFVQSRSRAEALNFLRDLSGNYIVYVDSRPAKNPDAVIAALKTIGPVMGHHSHPTKMIHVDIQTANGGISLVLGRDSGYAQEYWVFYPKYRITSNNEIGRVTTPLFDDY
jgi:hypothetical protein